tara:strand:- start:415 stop:1161 length:747 start_codon:yes stop_codon:yes gene_type:complete
MKLLKGKTAIVTGASRGIGKGIAREFAKNGANVAFTYSTSVDLAKEFEKELNDLGVKAVAYQSDASNYDDSLNLVDKISNDFESIDILVNNAGITRDNLLMRMQEDDFNNVIKVNLNSVFNMTKAVQKTMLKQRSGSIINMSSVVGVKGNAGQSNYAASKAGIIGFSKSIALELGSRNIRCNVIAPGFIETEMTENLDKKIIENWRNSIPLKRGGTPEDVANACVWLASDMSSYVTGQVLNIDGGLLT